MKSVATDVLTDEALLAGSIDNQTDAFLVLYDRYFGRVYTYFRYRFDDPGACDDLCAQTFEQALVHLADYRSERGPFAAWLFGIARNNANLQYRHSRRLHWLPYDLLAALPGNDSSPEELVIQADTQRRLFSYIEKLSPRQRDLLALKFSGQFNNRQIAAMTGLSEENVAIILFRSIRQLREKMENDHAG